MQSVCAVFYCHSWPVRLYSILLYYLINGTIFGNKITEHKICALIFSTSSSEKFLILGEFSELLSEMQINLYVKHSLFLRDINKT